MWAPSPQTHRLTRTAPVLSEQSECLKKNLKGPGIIEHQGHYCHITSFMFLSVHILSVEKDSHKINHIHVSESAVNLAVINHPVALVWLSPVVFASRVMEFLAEPRFVLSHKNTHFLGGTLFLNSFLLHFLLISTISVVAFLLNHWNELSRHLCCLLQTGWCHDSLQIENFVSQMSWLRQIIISLLWSGATFFFFFFFKRTVVLEPKQDHSK